MSKPNSQAVAQPDELAESPVDGGEPVVRRVPWFVISCAMHGVLFAVLWSLVVSVTEDVVQPATPTAIAPHELPEPPKIPPTQVLPEEMNQVIETEPTRDPAIIDDAKEDRNTDPTTDPNDDMRPNPNPNAADSLADSPWPATNSNSSIGMGGEIGGGSGPQGGGDFSFRRARKNSGVPGDTQLMMGLRWLRDHQMIDGSWNPKTYRDAGRKNGRIGEYTDIATGREFIGDEAHTAGLSGLALLAFLGAGYTHDTGEFQVTVRRGLRYLKAIQDNDGCFGSREAHSFTYDHAICAMAMAEAYGMTGSNLLRASAQKGVDFIAMAQNHDADRGWLGWRYGVRPGDSDTSVTGWMTLALKSARTAGLDVPERCWEGAIRFLDDMTGERMGYHKTGYLSRGIGPSRLQDRAHFAPLPSMDSVNILSRMFVAQDGALRRDPVVRGQAQQICSPENLPSLDTDHLDFYYWYYASLAMFQMGDEYWKKWEPAMGKALIESQRKDGDVNGATHGSWDTECCWGPAGGRIYSTAINCLTLEVYYRYNRVADSHGR